MHGKRVGNFEIIRLFHAYRRNAQAKKAGVIAAKLVFDAGEVVKVGVNNFFKFWMSFTTRLPVNDQYCLNRRVLKADMQHPLAYHAGTAGDDGSYFFAGYIIHV